MLGQASARVGPKSVSAASTRFGARGVSSVKWILGMPLGPAQPKAQVVGVAIVVDAVGPGEQQHDLDLARFLRNPTRGLAEQQSRGALAVLVADGADLHLAKRGLARVEEADGQGRVIALPIPT